MSVDRATPEARLADQGERQTALVTGAASGDAAQAARQAAMDPVVRSFAEWTLRLLARPQRLIDAQARLWRDSFALWQSVIESRNTGRVEPVIQPTVGDRRFAHRAWTDEPGWTCVQQSYLLMSRWLMELVDLDDSDPLTRRRLRFYMRQLVSAAAPTNFALTNPAALERARATCGHSFAAGLEHFFADLERGRGRPHLRHTPPAAFDVGHTIAATPGKVVFRNALMELIQYAPATPRVRERPLLIVPPCINKYYVLDLRPENSFVRYAVDHGLTVFMISWINPAADQARMCLEDYVESGVLAAMDAVERATGAGRVNLLGLCIGGMLTATALAHLAAKGDARVASATFLATLFDFEDAGEIGALIDDEGVAALEAELAATGLLDERPLADMFSMLRENDLIWSFVINNYLMGREPAPLDLLYWNGDGTRVPAPMISDCLRRFYLDNGLALPGTFEILGTAIDTRRVNVPTYALATRNDHIAPWRSCFAVHEQFEGPVRRVLGGSGHIAGIVNPPSRCRYGYWTGEDPHSHEADADQWLAGAAFHEGSWWPDWWHWLSRRAGAEVPARDPAAGGLRPLADAPGPYVRVRFADGAGG